MSGVQTGAAVAQTGVAGVLTGVMADVLTGVSGVARVAGVLTGGRRAGGVAGVLTGGRRANRRGRRACRRQAY